MEAYDRHSVLCIEKIFAFPATYGDMQEETSGQFLEKSNCKHVHLILSMEKALPDIVITEIKFVVDY